MVNYQKYFVLKHNGMCLQASICVNADSLLSKEEQLRLKELEDDELSTSFVLINVRI